MTTLKSECVRALNTRSVLELIQDFSGRLASNTDRQELYRSCLVLTKEFLHFDYSTLFLLGKGGEKLVIRATEGMPHGLVDSFVLEEGKGLPSYVLKTQRVETVGDFRREERFEVSELMTQMNIRSAMAAPMMISEKMFGALIGHSKAVREFSSEEKLLYQVLANHTAISLKNVMHIDSLYRSEEKRVNKIRELQLQKEVSRERTNEFESIFSNIMTGVVLLKGGRYLARCNLKFVEMFGYSSVDELVGMSLRDIHLSESHYKEFGRKYYGNLVAGEIVQGEYTFKKKDGSSILCNLSGRSIDQSSPPELGKGFVWVIEDISKKKEMEEEILQARKLESIGVLAGGIGHDFNNILSAIMGNIGLAQRLLEPNNKVQDLLESALEASDKAKDLTSKLLYFTRRDGHFVGSVKLSELVEEVNFSKFLGERVKLKIDIQQGLFSIKIMPDHLKAILQNLLLNADSCLPGDEGKVIVTGHNLELMEGDYPGLSSGKYVEIMVEDNGSGIDTTIVNNIFDPYFTTKNRDSSRGIGLGLAIVHSIVKKNFGHISVKSSRKRGTVFTVILPAAINDILAMKSYAAKTL